MPENGGHFAFVFSKGKRMQFKLQGKHENWQKL